MSSNTVIHNLAALFGRVLFSLIFIISGLGKIFQYNAMATMMSSEGMPYAEWLLVLAIILELGGGLMILFGYKTRLGAFGLFVFIFMTSLIFHDFWTYEPAQMTNQIHHFLKNFAMMGAALYMMAFGAGKYSIDSFSQAKPPVGE